MKLAELYYAGSHGMDIEGPAKGSKYKKVSDHQLRLFLFVLSKRTKKKKNGKQKPKESIQFLTISFVSIFRSSGESSHSVPTRKWISSDDGRGIFPSQNFTWLKTSSKNNYKIPKDQLADFNHEFSGLQAIGGEDKLNSKGQSWEQQVLCLRSFSMRGWKGNTTITISMIIVSVIIFFFT